MAKVAACVERALLAAAVREPAVARERVAAHAPAVVQDVEVVASRAATALVVGRVAAVAAGTRALRTLRNLRIVNRVNHEWRHEGGIYAALHS